MECKLLHDMLIRSERLAATGQLAASLAHEINSPLQAVLDILGAMKNNDKGHKEIPDNIATLEGVFNNIRNIVTNLLDLNRPGSELKQSVNINEIIRKTLDLMKESLKKNRFLLF